MAKPVALVAFALACILLLGQLDFSAESIGRAASPSDALATYQAFAPVVFKAEPAATATFTPSPTSVSVPPIQRLVDPQESWNWSSIQVVPGAQYAVIRIHMLDPCENHMMEVAFVEVQDELGNPLDGVTVRGQAGDYPIPIDVTSGDKGPGKAEITINYPVNLSAKAIQDSRGAVISDVAVNMENYHIFDNYNIPMSYRICAATGLEGNAPKHLSYRIVFKRVK